MDLGRGCHPSGVNRGASSRLPHLWARCLRLIGTLCFFQFFSSMVRIKIACKDISKIHKRRLFEMDNKFYLIHFKVEGSSEIGEDGADDGGDNDTYPANDYDTGMEELQHDALSDNQKPAEGRSKPLQGQVRIRGGGFERVWQ
jgi:hypothetical protein